VRKLLLVLALAVLSGAVGAGTVTKALTVKVNHTVFLTWVASVSSGVAGYNVYRGTFSGGPYSKITPQDINALDFNDLSVQPATTYFYVVTAVDPLNGESLNSNEATAVVP
jgi:fibronectin type 3 domain-containing protein